METTTMNDDYPADHHPQHSKNDDHETQHPIKKLPEELKEHMQKWLETPCEEGGFTNFEMINLIIETKRWRQRLSDVISDNLYDRVIDDVLTGTIGALLDASLNGEPMPDIQRLLWTIGRRRLIDLQRKRTIEFKPLTDGIHSRESIADLLGTSMERKLAMEQLNKLDETDRKLVLAKFEGKSNTQIGREAGVSDKTVAKRVSWAMELIKQGLD